MTVSTNCLFLTVVFNISHSVVYFIVSLSFQFTFTVLLRQVSWRLPSITSVTDHVSALNIPSVAMLVSAAAAQQAAAASSSSKQQQQQQLRWCWLYHCEQQMSPENSTRSDRHNYQTEILNNLMDQLLAADVLLGDQAALPSSSSSSTYTHLANNVFYLAGRIVDKLWQGMSVRLTINLSVCLSVSYWGIWQQLGKCQELTKRWGNVGKSLITATVCC